MFRFLCVLEAAMTFFLMSAACAATSGPAQCLTSYLREIEKSFIWSAPKDSLKNEVHALFADSSLTPSVAAKRAFERVMHERLLLFPAEIRASVEKVMNQNLKVLPGNFDPEYQVREKTVNIRMPQEFHQSVLDFTARVHELEHALQHAVREGLSVQFGKLKSGDARAYVRTHESGAILAELHFLATLPDAVLLKIQSDVRRSSSLLPEHKQIILGFLKGARLEPSLYLESQLKSGRLGVFSDGDDWILDDALNQVIAASAILAGVFATVRSCGHFQETGQTQGAFYRGVCAHVLF